MSDASGDGQRLAAGMRVGSYRLTRLIGEGGMGTVYEGVHEGLGKRVAIKTLHAGSARSPDVIARFLREGKAAAKIRHANVVDVFDVAVHEGTPYLVMEYLEGQDLGARMEHEAPMSPSAIADLMVPVASALAAAHEAGIVHRDLKPDNILITRAKGGVLEPKLVDFGISKLSDESLHLTGTNAILGTPYYMSPEQAGSSKQIDHRSDIFSLGVILYQCATHELPFKGDSLLKLLGEIVYSEPPRVSTIESSIPPAFEAVIARAMKKDPAQRFQSAAELGAALLPFASARVRVGYEHEFGAGSTAAAALASSGRGEPSPSTLEPMSGVVRARGPGGTRVLIGLSLLGALVGVAIALLEPGAHEPDGRSAAGSAQSTSAAPPPTSPPARVVPVEAPAVVPTRPVAAAADTASPGATKLDGGTSSDPPANSAAQTATAPSADPPRSATELRPSAGRPGRRAGKRARAEAVETTPIAAPAPVDTPPAVRAEPDEASPRDDDLFRDRK